MSEIQQPETAVEEQNDVIESQQETVSDSSSDPYGLEANKTEQDSESVEGQEISQQDGESSGDDRVFTQDMVNELMQKTVKEVDSRIKDAIQSHMDATGKSQSEAAQDINDAAQDINNDPSQENLNISASDDDLEKALARLAQKQQQQQLEQQKQKQLEDFVRKVNDVRQKYNDYDDVVTYNEKVGYDPVFLEAAESAEDPGQFMYAAAKNYSEDVDRISKIANPKRRFKEIVKLEEKMKGKQQSNHNQSQPISVNSDIASSSMSKSYDDFDSKYLAELSKNRA